MRNNVSEFVSNKASNGTIQIFDDWVYTSLTAYLVCIGFFCVFGNVTVLITFKKLKSTCKLFIINLAVSDLLMALLGFPFAIHSAFQKKWMYGDWGCNWYGFICFTSGASSIFSYFLIAFNRYLHVCYPNNDLFLKSKKGTFVSVGLIWVVSLFFTALPILGFGSYTFEKHGTTCTLDWESRRISTKCYIGLSFIVVLLLPSLAIVFYYYRVVKYLKTQIHQQPSIPQQNSENTLKRNINNRLLKILLVTMVAYFSLWIPYGGICLARSISYSVSKEVTLFLTMLAKLQCAVNPVVYAFTNSYWYNLFSDFLRRQIQRGRVLRITVTESSRDKYLESD